MARNNKRKSGIEDYENNWTESDKNRLQNLFKNGSLSLTDPISKVIVLDDYFKKFNSRSLGNRLGQFRKQFASSQTQSDSSTPTINVASSKQFASSQTLSDSSTSTVEETTPLVNSETLDVDECSLICSNMPFLRFTYMDAGKEKIVILLDLPGGSRNYEWEFNELGDGINLRVEWSRALCDASSSIESEGRQLTLDGAKIQAMQNMLSKKNIDRKEIPKCCIEVSLGKKVCKDDDSWEASVFKHERSNILMIEFTVYIDRGNVLKKIKRGSLANDSTF